MFEEHFTLVEAIKEVKAKYIRVMTKICLEDSVLKRITNFYKYIFKIQKTQITCIKNALSRVKDKICLIL